MKPAFSPDFSAIAVTLHAAFPRPKACTLQVNTMRQSANNIPYGTGKGWGGAFLLSQPRPGSLPTIELPP